MRKMPYAILFIVILAVLVFAGCKAFKLGGDDPSEDSTEATEPSATYEVPDTRETELPDVTDESTVETTALNGQTLPSEDVPSVTVTEPVSSTAGSETQSTTKAPETTTKAPATTAAPPESTTKAPETTTSAPAQPTANEYDILRSGKFYLQGSMYAQGQNNPIVLGVGSDIVYMQATMDGVTMGFLIKNKKTYLLNPAQKTYCEFGSMMSSILQQAGMMSEDEVLEYIDEMGFSSMDPLSEADAKTEGTIGSTSCDVYVFNKSDGTKTRVYMNGNKLMAFEIVDTNGLVDSATYITTLSSEIPELPPKDYAKQNILSFMANMEELLPPAEGEG